MSGDGADANQRFHEARERMVAGQIVARGISDPRLLDALRNVPRHLFVPPDHASEAYEDHPVYIGAGQTISQPYMVALMTEKLCLRGGDNVLEIGTGSGYQTAILARLAGAVYTVERIDELSRAAQAVLDRLGCGNVTYRVGDGSAGWSEHAPYDAILAAAAAESVPKSLATELAIGGGSSCR